MMNNTVLYTIIFLVSVFISSVSQIILKKSAQKKYENVLKEYLNPMVIGAYTIFLISTFLTTFAYKSVPLSFGPVLESTGYIYIAILGALILKEKMSKRKILGNGLIIIGIMVFAWL
ncbi:MAG: EamA family transporter [Eubacterium sp.]